MSSWREQDRSTLSSELAQSARGAVGLLDEPMAAAVLGERPCPQTPSEADGGG